MVIGSVDVMDSDDVETGINDIGETDDVDISIGRDLIQWDECCGIRLYIVGLEWDWIDAC